MKKGILSYIFFISLWVFPNLSYAQNPVIDDLIEQIVSKTGAENRRFFYFGGGFKLLP